MSLAKQAIQNAALREGAISVQFFSRSTVYQFSDGSSLTVNFMNSIVPYVAN